MKLKYNIYDRWRTLFIWLKIDKELLSLVNENWWLNFEVQKGTIQKSKVYNLYNEFSDLW